MEIRIYKDATFIAEMFQVPQSYCGGRRRTLIRLSAPNLDGHDSILFRLPKRFSQLLLDEHPNSDAQTLT